MPLPDKHDGGWRRLGVQERQPASRESPASRTYPAGVALFGFGCRGSRVQLMRHASVGSPISRNETREC